MLEAIATKVKVRATHVDTVLDKLSPRGLPLYTRVTTKPDGTTKTSLVIEGKNGRRPYKPKVKNADGNLSPDSKDE
jgi:hypothetical protein